MTVMEQSSTRVVPAAPKIRRRGGMSLTEAFRVAFQGLTANKLRAFLTMLGIIIGVAAVIITMALGMGAAQAAQDAIRKLGTNVLTIIPNSQQHSGVSQGLGSQQNMKLEEVPAVKKLCPSVKEISAEYRGNAQVKYQNQNTRTTIQGATPEYFEMRNLPMAKGRGFTDQEVRHRAKVAVIGDSVRDQLFGSDDALGKTIKMNGQNFTVIGLTVPRGGVPFRNPDDQVTIPVSTAMRRVFGSLYLSSLTVQAKDEKLMLQAEDEVINAYRKIHRLRPEDPPDVRVFNQADISESAAQQSQVMTMLLAGIALISLIVGGIGIMNIMLVSVTERTREIGIRKAIGAKRKDILYQFLIESVTLSLVGGIIGIGLGVGASLWMARPAGSGGLGFPMLITVSPMILSFASAAGVGVFFGIYPAMKASRLDPIEALRYE
jgi:putative ABC transport system permease protein